MLKLATWNVNSVRSRLNHIATWLKQKRPDILAIQETKVPDEKFPVNEFESLGYHVVFSGQKSYNGVAIMSRKTANDLITEFPDFPDQQKRILGATISDWRILNLYVPNGASLDSDKYEYKLNWLRHLRAYVQQQLNKHKKFVVLGDFNIAPTDLDVYDPRVWRDRILVSESERDALSKLIALGLHDAFRLFDNKNGGYSWWDYRRAAYSRDAGLRLDLVLLSDALAKRCRACYVDREPRTWETPSDHTPVIAEFD